MQAPCLCLGYTLPLPRINRKQQASVRLQGSRVLCAWCTERFWTKALPAMLA
jgi:hypothetical protein